MRHNFRRVLQNRCHSVIGLGTDPSCDTKTDQTSSRAVGTRTRPGSAAGQTGIHALSGTPTGPQWVSEWLSVGLRMGLSEYHNGYQCDSEWASVSITTAISGTQNGPQWDSEWASVRIRIAISGTQNGPQ
ncbi:hypothetical protein NDU88_000154 [Pleurodeles waltl]|uniref:Uncharacterized protein n=1 Tax=Pleurodeles waltl TaxID=8319 RepID=A0AAV7MR27_PLEWA|nr:hypothetical protein NDU88_000154 [Pleurodeles waltl]